MSIRVLIADDHEILRYGLRCLIEDQPDMKVVGEAENGRQAIELVEHCKPDVVIMDISMPNTKKRLNCIILFDEHYTKLHVICQVFSGSF